MKRIHRYYINNKITNNKVSGWTVNWNTRERTETTYDNNNPLLFSCKKDATEAMLKLKDRKELELKQTWYLKKKKERVEI